MLQQCSSASTVPVGYTNAVPLELMAWASSVSSFAAAIPSTRAAGDHVEFEVVFETTADNPLSQGVGRTLRWVAWKRYSEFETLDVALRSKREYAESGLLLPPKYWLGSLGLAALDPGFIGARRQVLESYIKRVVELVRLEPDFALVNGEDVIAPFVQWKDREGVPAGIL